MDIRRLLDHSYWADRLILAALEARPGVPAGALRELNHILGADEVWLSRLTRRPARAAVWPELTLAEARALADAVHAGYAACLETLDEPALAATVPYTNSAGQAFETPVGEILIHVALHAQYHRGKINQLLRDAGQPPVPTDYIAFSRGVPAATTPRNTPSDRPGKDA
jgi:uncharacterized damage-inducible protein DinB